ncbi:MAG: tRNA dihydrouridine(20/20a) synthase DusA [Cellvibrionaceae bacterium]
MPKTSNLNHRFCVAPMMDWSDRHCRYFWRLFSKNALLYTEMVTTGALLKGDTERFLQFNQEEHPVALQLGGSDPKALAECSRLAEEWHYDEVNLNCGCPSDRVKSGRFGACLMAEPDLVAECIQAMQESVNIPVTIKHRIGIDDQDEYDDLFYFVEKVRNTGCKTFIVHARKAWLQGLSPKQNREVPPLLYERVYQLKTEFPELNIIINGGISTLEESQKHLKHVDGVMIGREAYHNPYLLAAVDQQLFDSKNHLTGRDEILNHFILYCDRQIASGAKLNFLSRHVLGLYYKEKGGKIFRRYISENASKINASSEVLKNAREAMISAVNNIG